jgi:hypothetical protein
MSGRKNRVLWVGDGSRNVPQEQRQALERWLGSSEFAIDFDYNLDALKDLSTIAELVLLLTKSEHEYALVVMLCDRLDLFFSFAKVTGVDVFYPIYEEVRNGDIDYVKNHHGSRVRFTKFARVSCVKGATWYEEIDG